MLGFLLRPLRRRFGADRDYYRMVNDVLGADPGNIELYKLALVHRSASLFLEDGTAINNERLEFLGDAILEAVVSDYLFIEYPARDEGFLTQLRSKIVSRQSLNRLARRIGLDGYVVCHAGGQFAQKHIFGDALEAMIGALYLDKGYDFTNRLLIDGLLRRHIDLDELLEEECDYKSRLIEWCQKSKHTIAFRTGQGAGSAMHRPFFEALVLIDGIEVGHGSGASKKEAEQDAACAVSQVMSDEAGGQILDRFDKLIERTQMENRG